MEGAKRISVKKIALFFALGAFSTGASAEYYVVYSEPTAVVYETSGSPCRVYHRPVHYRKHHVTRPCYRKRSCDMSVYYSWPTYCGCNAVCPGVVVEQPAFNVIYGQPVYRADTYHPAEEGYSSMNWDMRTADDV